MFKKIFSFLIISIFCFGDSLQSDIDRATAIVRDFGTSIPNEVLQNARGFIFIGSVGSGLIIARADVGWSAPSAIGTSSFSKEVTDFVIVLNTKAAVDVFAQGGSVTLGENLSIAAGPSGSTAKGELILPTAAIFTYSRSPGGFVGVPLEGAVFVERNDDNARFYGKPVTPSQLLYGQVLPPQSAGALYNELNRY